MDVDSDLSDIMTGVGGGSTASTSNSGEPQLDLTFILDCTGSMGSYIASATKNIELIVENILQSDKLMTPDSLRVGLIAYRDHPPQDHSYVTNNFDFTSDVSKVKESLKSLFASGGGDGPEAVTAGMKAALDLQWRPQASKMAVLIADAPPHGIGEYGDGFPQGSPDGEDPLQLVRQMASQGITLFIVACEPSLSGYLYGTDFFRALTVISSAVMVPLTTAALLSHVIVGSALEQMDMERLIREVGLAVAERVHGGNESVDDVAKELHEKLLLRNESTKQLVVEDIYRDSPEARHNVEIFTASETLSDARSQLKKVIGSRFTEKYLQTRYTSSYSRSSVTTYPPAIPARSTPSTSTSTSTPERESTVLRSREVLKEFKPFSASPSGMSFASTPLASTTTPTSTTGTALGGSEVDDLAQSVELRFQAISLDQAKRITVAAAWRSAPPRA